MAAVPVQFQELARGPASARVEIDRRFEQAAAYLPGSALGINSLLIPVGTSATTRPIWSPGFISFGGNLLEPGGVVCNVGLQFLDPITQAVVYDETLLLGYIGSSTSGPFYFGSMNNQLLAFWETQLVWLLWQLTVVNSDALDATCTLDLIANARCSL